MKPKTMISYFFILAPLIITLIMLPMLPELIPAHFDLSGNVTRFGSRFETLIAPIIAAMIGLLLILYGRKQQNAKVVFWVNIGVMSMFLAFQAGFLYLAHTSAEAIAMNGFPFSRIVAIVLSISWVIIGNVMPKCRQNYILGIRTSWTLKSELSWNKTHRLGGRIMVIFGLATLLLSFVLDGEIGVRVSLVGPIVITVPLVIYSYYVYKQDMQLDQA